MARGGITKKYKTPKIITPKQSKAKSKGPNQLPSKYKQQTSFGDDRLGGSNIGRPSVQNKTKKDDVADLEQQFVLSLPPGPAMALRHEVQTGAQNLKDKLSIELPHDKRKGYVRFGGDVYNAKLVDLPCIIESWKTLDKKTLYKTADICQMLTCSLIASDSDDECDTIEKKKQKEKKYTYNHGLTAPLKNVRKKRFRRTTKKKVHQEAPDIEREVKRLLRADSDAIDVKWEVVFETDTENETTGTSGHIGEAELFGAISSDEEDDVHTAADIDEDAENSRLSIPSNVNEQSSDGNDFPNFDDQLTIIKKELDSLNTKKETKKRLLSSTDVDDVKKTEKEIAEIEQQESEKKKEVEILESMTMLKTE